MLYLVLNFFIRGVKVSMFIIVWKMLRWINGKVFMWYIIFNVS